MTAKKRDCNISVKIKVLTFKIKLNGRFFKFSKIFKIHKIRILDFAIGYGRREGEGKGGRKEKGEGICRTNVKLLPTRLYGTELVVQRGVLYDSIRVVVKVVMCSRGGG